MVCILHKPKAVAVATFYFAVQKCNFEIEDVGDQKWYETEGVQLSEINGKNTTNFLFLSLFFYFVQTGLLICTRYHYSDCGAIRPTITKIDIHKKKININIYI